MVRYPLGGMMSWALQYPVGFQQLGHDVYIVEKGGYPNACYDPVNNLMGDDCTHGVRSVDTLLAQFGLDDHWCFVDLGGRYYGLSRERIEAVFRSADLFVDVGTHGSWLAEAADVGLRVLVDGEPGFTQMKMQTRLAAGDQLPTYDAYYTCGQNIGTEDSTAPDGGRQWGWLFHPIVLDLFPLHSAPPNAPFTTVMNWQSYEPFSYGGVTYAHKDHEFWKFLELPRATKLPLELAVSGKGVPTERLVDAGWRLRDAHEVTASVDAFGDYIRTSRGEFSVCKHGYVATNCGWFSDRSAAYLASGRPVVMQETGFSSHLPCGRGLFAVHTVDEAAAALDEIDRKYEHHATAAREVAAEYLDARTVLGRFLRELGF
jgi:hypothetical protein